jgi:hypothetical protein
VGRGRGGGQPGPGAERWACGARAPLSHHALTPPTPLLCCAGDAADPPEADATWPDNSKARGAVRSTAPRGRLLTLHAALARLLQAQRSEEPRHLDGADYLSRHLDRVHGAPRAPWKARGPRTLTGGPLHQRPLQPAALQTPSTRRPKPSTCQASPGAAGAAAALALWHSSRARPGAARAAAPQQVDDRRRARGAGGDVWPRGGHQVLRGQGQRQIQGTARSGGGGALLRCTS